MSTSSGKGRIKRIYESSEEADGTRALVGRVWPRGMTKERAAVDLWFKEVAPSLALRKWFGHDPQRWPEFRSRYRAELDRNPAVVGQLRDLAMKSKVTLLYAARLEPTKACGIRREIHNFTLGRSRSFLPPPAGHRGLDQLLG